MMLSLLLPACTVNIGTGDDRTPTPAPTPATASPRASPNPAGSPSVTEVIGSGNVISESRPVAGFKRVRLRGSGNLLVEQTGVESLTIEAEDNILPLLRSDVENGQLILGLRPGTRIVTHKPIVYRLTVKELEGIEGSGSGSVDAKGLNTDRFSFDGSGSIEVRLAGRADELELSISGSGEYDGESLTSRRARVEVSGSADVLVNAQDVLDVQLSGSGDVRYVGNPTVTQRVSGSGSVTKK